MKEKVSKDRLLSLLDKIMQPKVYGISEDEGDHLLLTFCDGCPDPVKARWLIVECLDPMSDEELVDRALAIPRHKMADVPLSELPSGHPLRAMAL
ncbi:hypothetical protein ACQUKI_15965 [Ralstonia pseudosolanacearum]